jgi:hypothetical protein
MSIHQIEDPGAPADSGRQRAAYETGTWRFT